jgi:putative hemolysin
MARDLLAQALSGQPMALQSLLHPMLIVPEGLPVLQMLERFKDHKAQMALVIDEYGEMQGLITLNDLLEEIVGDIPEAGDPTDPQAMQQDDGSWLIDGMFPTEDFRELFDLDVLPGEEDGYYYTVGGFVMFFLGRVPKEGDHFEWDRFRLSVVDMDLRRVDKVMLTIIPPSLTPKAQEEV